MSDYEPTNLAKVFELLDQQLVKLETSGGLSFVGILKVSNGNLLEGTPYFAAAASVWIITRIGRRLAPEIDDALDWCITSSKRAIGTVSANFTGQFLKRQAQLNDEFVTEGFNPDRITIPLLEKMFVPLELDGATTREILSGPKQSGDAVLHSGDLRIWELLRRSRREKSFRQMSILAKGGMGKTTLLRHIALIYGQRKQRRYRAPNLVPILLRLRNWVGELTQSTPTSLAKLITDHYVPKLWEGYNSPPEPPERWAENLLASGKQGKRKKNRCVTC